jgi:hypothetical protein
VFHILASFLEVDKYREMHNMVIFQDGLMPFRGISVSSTYWDVNRCMAEFGMTSGNVINTGSAMGVLHFGLVHGS